MNTAETFNTQYLEYYENGHCEICLTRDQFSYDKSH